MKTKEKAKEIVDKAFEKAVEKEWVKTSAYIEMRKESGKDFISSKIMGEHATVLALLGRIIEVLLESGSTTVEDIMKVIEITKSKYESK